MNVAFRVDASSDIGIGHLMRCLALSEELIRREHSCYFLSKIDNDELISRIKKNNVHYQKINPNATLQTDVETLIKFSNENDVDWIITDHYGINSQYIKEIKKNNLKVLSIDDNAQIHYYSDIIVNQNIGAEKLDFSSEKYSKFLLGTKYVMLRDELLQKYKRGGTNKVTKILIMLGGADPDNVTLKVLRMLECLNESVQFLVVTGPVNRFYDDILYYINKCNMDITLLKGKKKMSDVYLQSDIAISAGGSSCYELAYFGIPNIIIAIVDNQVRIARELNNQNISIYLGEKNEVKPEQLRNKIKTLIDDYLLRKTMSEHGKKLIDGKGKHKIVNVMERIY
ncbi:MAG: UDP-2,4-diacetamido-2,4,6-trideoxy-beta-L-altropyranose hydrolase [Thermoplasmatales archaeon]|nr:UDP-2,4-diacetamido-2,4,6-trideoxy-beta-L-altropyranose hydrolase [Thermoplasmatales archaeon]